MARSFERAGADLSTFRYKMIAGVDDGVPWVAEAACAHRPPDSNSRVLLAGINWSPALRANTDPFNLGYQLGSDWCGLGEPIVLLAHLICPRPEFVDRGKSSLARHSPGYELIKRAVELVTADWAKQRKSEIRDRRREANRQERMRASRCGTYRSRISCCGTYPRSSRRSVNTGG